MFGELPKRPTERQTELHNTHMIHPLRKLLYLISRETKTQAPHVITFFSCQHHNECLLHSYFKKASFSLRLSDKSSYVTRHMHQDYWFSSKRTILCLLRQCIHQSHLAKVTMQMKIDQGNICPVHLNIFLLSFRTGVFALQFFDLIGF